MLFEEGLKMLPPRLVPFFTCGPLMVSSVRPAEFEAAGEGA
jgi:hypothetical protein